MPLERVDAEALKGDVHKIGADAGVAVVCYGGRAAIFFTVVVCGQKQLKILLVLTSQVQLHRNASFCVNFSVSAKREPLTMRQQVCDYVC